MRQTDAQNMIRFNTRMGMFVVWLRARGTGTSASGVGQFVASQASVKAVVIVARGSRREKYSPRDESRVCKKPWRGKTPIRASKLAGK